VHTRVPLESEHLAFVSRDLPTSQVLEIVSLVRLGLPDSSGRNACYFLESRLKDGYFSYVSYHFADNSRIQVKDHELEALVGELSGEPS